MPDIRMQEDPGSTDYKVLISIGRNEMMGGKFNIGEALQRAVDMVAEKYVEENMSDILELMNPEAIANLAIADSAKLIRTQFIDPQPEKKEEK